MFQLCSDNPRTRLWRRYRNQDIQGMCLIVNLFNRTVGRSENPGLPVLFERNNLLLFSFIRVSIVQDILTKPNLIFNYIHQKNLVEISTSLKDQLEMPKIKDRRWWQNYFGPYKTILRVSHSISWQYSHCITQIYSSTYLQERRQRHMRKLQAHLPAK